jgi:hypothetical protein
MTQPKFAPIAAADEVRSAYHLEVPRPWRTHRPGEIPATGRHVRGGGEAGPDQGYALGLVEPLTTRLLLAEGEHLDDIVAGVVAIGLARAALVGRAPVRADLEVAARLFGLFDSPTAELVARRASFGGVAHDYLARRELVASVPVAALRLTVAAASPAAL